MASHTLFDHYTYWWCHFLSFSQNQLEISVVIYELHSLPDLCRQIICQTPKHKITGFIAFLNKLVTSSQWWTTVHLHWFVFNFSNWYFWLNLPQQPYTCISIMKLTFINMFDTRNMDLPIKYNTNSVIFSWE